MPEHAQLIEAVTELTQGIQELKTTMDDALRLRKEIEMLNYTMEEIRQDFQWLTRNMDQLRPCEAIQVKSMPARAQPEPLDKRIITVDDPDDVDGFCEKVAAAVVEMETAAAQNLEKPESPAASPQAQTFRDTPARVLPETDSNSYFVIENPRKGKRSKTFLAKIAGESSAWDQTPKEAMLFASYKSASSFLTDNRRILPKATIGIVRREFVESKS